MKTERVERIETALGRLSPAALLVKDQSHLHAGHAGAEDGRGHFEIIIVSNAFVGKRPLERHRMVFDAVGGLMQTDIHALNIKAYSPDEKSSI